MTDLVTTAHPGHPELDMALTGALLSEIARGEAPDTLRVFRPGPTVAFGRLDRARRGFDEAWRVAMDHGRTPVIRWGGGHAAAYDPGSVVIELLRHHASSAIAGLQDRYLDMIEVLRAALANLDVTVELGELPREYCPGRYSLHLPAGPKVAGVAQRILNRASLTTAVVVVAGGDALRAVLVDVYGRLAVPFDPETAGAVCDRYPDVRCELAMAAILETAVARYRIARTPLRRPGSLES
jgi:octanoyl-[GcvH]:protein N-octanoyltransferase